MRLQEVADPHDPRVVAFTGLTDVAARCAREPRDGIFLAEGAKVIARATSSGYRPLAVLTEPRWLAGLRPILEGRDVEVLVAPAEVVCAVAGYRVHRGALATMARRPLPPPEDVVDGARLVAVLVDLVDHTNVGAIFRSAAALGVGAVLLTPGCADPLYRRSVKVSMGAVLAVRWTRLGPGWMHQLRDLGLQTVALTPADGALDIDGLPPARTARAVLVGTEGDGLPAEVMAAADLRAGIPMAAGVDSLNVAAASAIAFHVLSRDARASSDTSGAW